MCFLKSGEKISKRPEAMSKPANIIRSGWMTKSPPEQKLQSPLKIFRAKWKQRFFVLHKPTGSLPDQYELSYYNSEQCSKKKGSIDLDQCEQVIESLDSNQYPYLLAIKTVCRGKVRTYYLATNSEEDMCAWVDCLCHVCGLKQEDTRKFFTEHATDIPDPRLGNPAGSSSPPFTHSSVRTTPTTTGGASQSQPAQGLPPRRETAHVTSGSQPARSTSPESYLPLDQCRSGRVERPSERTARTESVDSVPEYHAPPPPAKKGSHANVNINNNEKDVTRMSHDGVFDSTYDRPPPTGQETYDRPPSGGQEMYDRPPHAGGLEVYDRPPPQETYDHPPAGGHDVYNRPRSGYQDMYDRPRSGELRGSHSSLDDDVYKVPPSGGGLTAVPRIPRRPSPSDDQVDLHAAVPLPIPRRSPRSARSSLSDRPESVESLGDSYDVPPPRPSSSSQEGGDFPDGPAPTPPLRPPKPHSLKPQSPYQNLPSGNPEDGGLSAVPSAPKQCGPGPLSYDIPRASTAISPPREPSVLDLAPPPPPLAPRNCGPSGNHSYLNMSNAPSQPPLPDSYQPGKSRQKRGVDLPYADSGTETYANMGGAGGQDLYQVPPVAPHPPARSITMPTNRGLPAGAGAGAGGGGSGGEVEAHYIWSNTRTKSFKRNNNVNASPLPVRPPPPDRRRPLLPSRPDQASSSDDDDDLSTDGNDTHQDLRMVRMSAVPDAPGVDAEPELKYLDLALDTPSDDDRSRPQVVGSHGSGTEYREIDFLKTRALEDTKKARSMNK